MRLLMVFIDGFGLGSGNAGINPFFTAETPFLHSLLGNTPFTLQNVNEQLVQGHYSVLPVDAVMGVPGIPQSATGQTSFLAGINASAVAGRHIQGFPTGKLRGRLAETSIFKVLTEGGLRAVFANTFTDEYFEAIKAGKARHSATTVAALAGGGRLRNISDLKEGEAVYHDLSNELLIERGYMLPLISPEQAGENLLRVSARNDFTLFEYFQTDRCGHGQDWAASQKILNRLDRFLGTLARFKPDGLQLLIVSDHGNIEDLSRKTHTMNPVPLITLGTAGESFRRVGSLPDIYHAVTAFFGIDKNIIEPALTKNKDNSQ